MCNGFFTEYGYVIKKITNANLFSNLLASEGGQLNLVEVKPGVGEPVIFIDGFLTEEKDNTDDWESQLKEIYPYNPWYHLVWESKNLKAIGAQISLQLGSRMLAGRVLASATPLGWSLFAYSVVSNPWTKAYARAKAVGAMLGEAIAETDQHFILCGHSLGARVIFHALANLSTKDCAQVHEVHLLGGAVSNRAKNWEAVTPYVRFGINNYTSQNDRVLSMLYKVGTAFTSHPIGIRDIEVEGVNNIDVSHIVKGHTEFKDNFFELVLHKTKEEVSQSQGNIPS
ncbi:DUF726 domain-containing protein [Leucothrix sargassi]|nr:DUF726 domain-containing protein [Leucothrix sargassi]